MSFLTFLLHSLSQIIVLKIITYLMPPPTLFPVMLWLYSFCLLSYLTHLSYLLSRSHAKEITFQNKLKLNSHSLNFSFQSDSRISMESSIATTSTESTTSNIKVTCLSCFQALSRNDKIFSCKRKHNFCAPCGKSILHLQCEVCFKLNILSSGERIFLY